MGSPTSEEQLPLKAGAQCSACIAAPPPASGPILPTRLTSAVCTLLSCSPETAICRASRFGQGARLRCSRCGIQGGRGIDAACGDGTRRRCPAIAHWPLTTQPFSARVFSSAARLGSRECMVRVAARASVCAARVCRAFEPLDGIGAVPSCTPPTNASHRRAMLSAAGRQVGRDFGCRQSQQPLGF